MQGDDTISTAPEQGCAQEPIHLLGTLQPHGFLIAADDVALMLLDLDHFKKINDA